MTQVRRGRRAARIAKLEAAFGVRPPRAGNHKPAVDPAALQAENASLRIRVRELESILHTPEVSNFLAGVEREVAHQRARWGVEHDAGKTPPDWFWLIGYLAGKALAAAIAGDVAKAKHHTISTAAVCAQWHAFLAGDHSGFRPGIDPAERGVER